jgi:hypothetical protein
MITDIPSSFLGSDACDADEIDDKWIAGIEDEFDFDSPELRKVFKM